MSERTQALFQSLFEKFINFLPDFFAGILLILIGWFLAWFVKRVLMQVFVILRLERFLTRLRWGEDFSKADVRYGFYSFLGNIGFFIVFLIFLDDAMVLWKLTILSDFLKQGIFFIPRILASLTVFGIGFLISSWAAGSIQRGLKREDIPRTTLISRYIKAVVLLFFSAMALAVLDIAREIVTIGFATAIITLGAVTVIFTSVSARHLLQNAREEGADD